jgi:hypothetical protein
LEKYVLSTYRYSRSRPAGIPVRTVKGRIKSATRYVVHCGEYLVEFTNISLYQPVIIVNEEWPPLKVQ